MDLSIRRFVADVLQEDMGRGDLFAQCTKPVAATARIIAKEAGVLAGIRYAEVLKELAGITIEWQHRDGDRIQPGECIATISGTNTALLSIERTFLNMLQHASGIATNAARYADILKGSKVVLLDTRKTRPLLRSFEKYAVRCGGAVNHRMGLDDALMLKDTHLKTIPDLKSFMAEARKNIPFTAKIEIECETVTMAKEALEAGADIIMCDNMTLDAVNEVILLRNTTAPATLIEVSGNIDEQILARYRDLGVDALSSGSIIHQATWLDFSMKMQ